MGLNKEAIKIGFAYVGIVVGAGFSTGQEVMQFFHTIWFMVIYWSDYLRIYTWIHRKTSS